MQSNIYASMSAEQVNKLVRRSVNYYLSKWPGLRGLNSPEDYCQMVHVRLLGAKYKNDRPAWAFVARCTYCELINAFKSSGAEVLDNTKPGRYLPSLDFRLCWQELPKKARDLLHQRYILGRTRQELSQELGLTLSQLRGRERAAINTAKKYFAEVING